ncbi:hypothetical protein ASE14_11730 [Agromyces sp. Root81]|uniref:hypothetical protein n=1 Tax=Agromyces sp. Root81 TaxID=1736601 RepID=UPI0006FD7391|nr:hypothetical protein [Agromyces sp. Root81]KRC61518.1 hypothetical protein ASE14_11730 [Agromyces sp. Root81]
MDETDPEFARTAGAATGVGAPSDRSDGPIPPRIRIRWGWFFGCIVLGLAAIVAGWFLVSPASRLGYVGGVLAGVGTTLLLVGIVVLLERRIVDTAVRVVQDANKAARIRANEELRAQISDFEDRVAGIWETRAPQDAAEQTRRMSDEFTKRMVDGYAEDDETPSA